MSTTDNAVLFQELGPDSKLVFAFLGSRNIGDFAEQVVTAAAVKENLEGYRLAVFYNQDRPYKERIVSLCPSVDIVLAGPNGMQFPINIFDVYAGRVAFDDPSLEAHGMNKSTIILAGNSLPGMCLPSLDHVPRLRVPPSVGKDHEARLRELGLDPERWFACVYWREPGFNDRPAHPLRDILDPAPYFAAIDHIVDTLGGQVVRLGHPTDTPLRSHPDILDIAKLEDSLMTQIVAISLARFFIASPSGPLTFGSAFGTPTAVTDNIDISGVWNDHDLLMTQKITTPDGHRVQGRTAFDAGLLKAGLAGQLVSSDSGYSYAKNTHDELVNVADTLYRRTMDCLSWRRTPSLAPIAGGKGISLPLRISIKSATFL
jgi:putative glycosyltransferase (TIGR04372 family)